MKLLLCRKCQDVVKFQTTERSCLCGECKGRYLKDRHTVEYSGEPAVILGVDNNSLRHAICSVDPDLDFGARIAAIVEEGNESGVPTKINMFRISEKSPRVIRKN